MPINPTLLPIQAQQNSMSPQMPYPQQQQQAPGLNNGTVPGGVAAMIKALFDGQSKYKHDQMQQTAQPAQQPVGAPLSLAPPSGAAPPASGLPGVQVPMNPAVGLPGMPNGIDPSMRGLFSSIPGQGG